MTNAGDAGGIPTPIDSLKDLQNRSREIAQRITADERLHLASMANPLFAMEDLGLNLTPELRATVEDRCRFSPDDAAKRRELRKEIFDQAGGSFDLTSLDEVMRVLVDERRIAGRKDVRAALKPPAARDEPDPLARFSHDPVVKTLVAYRRIPPTAPPFASRDLYDAIKSGSRKTVVRKVSVRFIQEQRSEGTPKRRRDA